MGERYINVPFVSQKCTLHFPNVENYVPFILGGGFSELQYIYVHFETEVRQLFKSKSSKMYLSFLAYALRCHIHLRYGMKVAAQIKTLEDYPLDTEPAKIVSENILHSARHTFEDH